MMKKLLTLLSLSAFVSLIIFSAFLYNGDRASMAFVSVSRIVKSKTGIHLWTTKENLKDSNMLQGTTVMGKPPWKEIKMVQNTTQVPASSGKSLELCPETPPNLVGPLFVEFSTKRTLEQVREAVGGPLQEGGRYKPPECISRHKVAVIIPFRNRHEHLIYWLYYLHPILIRQQLDYGVYVINQDGEGVFNRAKLMNAGYVEVLKEYDYDCFVFSDIDLVPMDDRNFYKCFDNPRHLAVAMDKFNFHLPYNTYFGGVSSLSKQQFTKINGFPNTYWGWGGEDDDIYKRVIYSGMQISRPDSSTGMYRMVKHERDLHNEPNPQNPWKINSAQQNMKSDGLNSLSYTVKDVRRDRLFTMITVDIQAPPS